VITRLQRSAATNRSKTKNETILRAKSYFLEIRRKCLRFWIMQLLGLFGLRPDFGVIFGLRPDSYLSPKIKPNACRHFQRFMQIRTNIEASLLLRTVVPSFYKVTHFMICASLMGFAVALKVVVSGSVHRHSSHFRVVFSAWRLVVDFGSIHGLDIRLRPRQGSLIVRNVEIHSLYIHTQDEGAWTKCVLMAL